MRLEFFVQGTMKVTFATGDTMEMPVYHEFGSVFNEDPYNTVCPDEPGIHPANRGN